MTLGVSPFFVSYERTCTTSHFPEIYYSSGLAKTSEIEIVLI